MPKVTRRQAVFSGLSALGASTAACQNEPLSYDISFHHGVASGDPGADRVIIWTRITPVQDGAVSVRWEVSEFNDFSKLHRKGKFKTRKGRDYTVKIDVTRLKPGTQYFYRFKVGSETSPIGRTKTLPTGKIEKARFAIVSCSHYGHGFFNAYDAIAKHDHFDAVLHLGDYYYEYGRGGFSTEISVKLNRLVEPAHEILTLSDYRTRHAQYKSDEASQAVHAAHPFICVWDDHEVANDSWKAGAQNHNKDEGSWDDRRANAMQAYYEWMPVRDPKVGVPKESLFRSYSFGDLLSLTAIETRLTARTKPLGYGSHSEALQSQEGVDGFIKTTLGDPKRELLGPAQKEHIRQALRTSKSLNQPWRLIANQVLMARIATPNITDYEGEDFVAKLAKYFPHIHRLIRLSPFGLPVSLDTWDGYPAARERFYAMTQAEGTEDLLVLTGDSHACWANKLVTQTGKNMGVELGTTSVTSPGRGFFFGDKGPDYSRRLTAKNDDIIYHSLDHHGYIDLTLTPKEGRADFVSVDTIYSTDYKTFISKRIRLVKAAGTLKLQNL